jgi:hypothetical protein
MGGAEAGGESGQGADIPVVGIAVVAIGLPALWVAGIAVAAWLPVDIGEAHIVAVVAAGGWVVARSVAGTAAGMLVAIGDQPSALLNAECAWTQIACTHFWPGWQNKCYCQKIGATADSLSWENGVG